MSSIGVEEGRSSCHSSVALEVSGDNSDSWVHKGLVVPALGDKRLVGAVDNDEGEDIGREAVDIDLKKYNI